ncbi:MAG: hypothetical protein Q4G63_10080 [Bacteroidia bacterium]|nr:hypothetical protein [Bacteroidia bacterium]
MEAAIIITAIFQLILLAKIWQMTNDVSHIKKSLDVVQVQFLSEKGKITAIDEKVSEHLKVWYKVKKTSNSYALKEKLDSAFIREEPRFDKWIDQYGASDFYGLDDLKNSMIERFRK